MPRAEDSIAAARAELSQGGPVVFYDEICGLCDWSVSWLMKRDRAARLRFAPLQGETAQSVGFELSAQTEGAGSMALVDSEGAWQYSDAALRSAEVLGGIYRFARLLRFIPRFIRDNVYRFIARHRYRWFGKLDTCRLPTPAEVARFLP